MSVLRKAFFERKTCPSADEFSKSLLFILKIILYSIDM